MQNLISKIRESSGRDWLYYSAVAGGVSLFTSLTFWGIRSYLKNRPHASNNQQSSRNIFLSTETDLEDPYELNDRILYEQSISDASQFSLCKWEIDHNPHLSALDYKIIFNLNKGNIYQGVVKISFFLNSKKHAPPINFNGTTVKYLSINSQVVPPEQIIYERQQIRVKNQENSEYWHSGHNKVEIIFENKYSFMDDGLSTYFILDDSHKYSLKEQVIYTKNGAYEVQRIVPCLNCYNECTVSVEMIYPENFEAFSNAPKSLEHVCSVQEFPQYAFFFAQPERGLNKSQKLGSSFSSAQNYESSTLNTGSVEKRNSKFYPTDLPSIHHLFVFCSNVIEIQSNLINVSSSMSSKTVEDKILVRYFAKNNKYDALVRNIATLHRYINEICERLSLPQKIEKIITKIDVFFLADREVQGYFAPGAILLDEESLEHGVHIKIFYLVARAILGIYHLMFNAKKSHLQRNKLSKTEDFQSFSNYLDLPYVTYLNEETFNRFPECRGYLYFKQQDMVKVHKIFSQKSKFLEKNSLRFIQYYYKEIPYLLDPETAFSDLSKIPFELRDLSERLKVDSQQTYWNHLVSQYNFLSLYISEILLKVSIARKGVPYEDTELRYFAQENFSKSKFYLDFFTDQEIQNNLGYFLEHEAHHLESRLTKIKIKEKYRDLISEKYESYLPLKENVEETKKIYEQFRRFKESRNFHHVSVLKHQIKRIKMFGDGDFIEKATLQLECGFMAWKLLSKIQIYPLDKEYQALINELEVKADQGADKVTRKCLQPQIN